MRPVAVSRRLVRRRRVNQETRVCVIPTPRGDPALEVTPALKPVRSKDGKTSEHTARGCTVACFPGQNWAQCARSNVRFVSQHLLEHELGCCKVIM